MVIKHYRIHTGTLAFIFHRISGIALIFYLPLYIWVTHFISSNPGRFDKTMAFLSQPLFKFAEVALLGAILYHVMNGIRIILIDLDIIKTKVAQKAVFWVLFIAMFPVLLWVGYVFLLKHIKLF